MKYYLLFIFGLFLPGLLRAQPAKAYLNAESFKNGKFIELGDVTVQARDIAELNKSYGGNLRIKSEDKDINKKLRNEYWAVEKDTFLYINAGVVFQKDGYTVVTHRTREFLYFKVAMGKTQASMNAATAGLLFGAVGGAIAGGITAAVTPSAIGAYILYIDWGEPMPLTRKSFTHLLEMRKDTALLAKYEQEDYPTSQETYFKYLDLMDHK